MITKKILGEDGLRELWAKVKALVSTETTARASADTVLDARIDNIIAGGKAPSAAEVTDARVGADGATYASLGSSIRNQVANLKNDLYTITGNNSITISGQGKYIDLSGSSVTMSDGVPASSGSSATYSYCVVPCQPNDIFTINGTGGSQTRLWGFVSSTGSILNVSSSNASATDLIIKAPANSAFLIVHGKTSTWESSYVGKFVNVKLDELSEGESGLSNAINKTNNGLSLVAGYANIETVSGGIVETTHGNQGAPITINARFSVGQSGSGTPAPDNVRDFSTLSGVDIYASNKNIFTGALVNRAYDSGVIISNSNYRAIYQRVVGGKYYTVSRTDIEGNRFRIATTVNEPTDTEPISTTIVSGDEKYSLTYFVPDGYNYIFVYLSNQGDTIDVSNYQIEYGTEATNFIEHKGVVKELSFSDPSYGGELSCDRFGNWELANDHVGVTFNGTETWAKDTHSSNNHGAVFYLTKAMPFETFSSISDWANIDAKANWLDKSDTATSDSSKSNSFWWNTSATAVRVVYGTDPDATLEEFKAALASEPLVIVGKSAEATVETLEGNALISYNGTNVVFSTLDSISVGFGISTSELIEESVVNDYDVSTSNMLGNITVKAAKAVNFSDGTQPVIEWYLLQDINNNFYMSKDLKSKRFLFKFVPPSSVTSNWSFGIDAENNVYCILQASALASSPRLDDNNRTVNPVVLLASEDYSTMHEIDFGNNMKPVGWLGNYGWCVLPNKDIIMCEYTRANVGTANVWHIDGSDPTDADSWDITWSHSIVENEDSDLGMKHCHFVQYDFFEDVCYFGTGDSDVASWIYHSVDNGETWELTYGPNKRKCRLLTFVFTKDYVYWASDSYESDKHYFYKAERVDGVIDVENATGINLGAVNKQACYGCVYLQSLNLIVMMDRNDTTVPDDWTFVLSGYDMSSEQVVTLGDITPLGENAGFRTAFVDWYPIDNHILVGFDPAYSSTGLSTNQNAVCGNQGGYIGNGSTRINNLVLSVYKHDSDYSIRFDTICV